MPAPSKTDNLVTTSVTDSVADSLLTQAGFRVLPVRHGGPDAGVYYLKPGGNPRNMGGILGEDYLWQLDEALTQALVIIAERETS